MFNFNFYNPTRIYFGKDRLESINENVPVDAKVLITYGGGREKRSGLIDKVKSILGSREIFEFSGIEPNLQKKRTKNNSREKEDGYREINNKFMFCLYKVFFF